jgi:hypothetical protein
MPSQWATAFCFPEIILSGYLCVGADVPFQLNGWSTRISMPA